MKIFLLLVSLCLPGPAVAQVPCLRDPVTGRPVVPQGHTHCTTRTAPPSPDSRPRDSRTSSPDGLSDRERREAAKRDAKVAEAQRSYDEGLRAWDAGDYDRAIDKLKDAVAKARALPAMSPANVTMHRRFNASLHRALAMRAARANDFETARRMLRLAREADPEDATRHDEMDAWLEDDRRRYEEILALGTHRRALEAFESGDWERAITEARRMVERDPANADGLRVLAHALLETKRWREAEPVIVQQTLRNPDDANAISNLGVVASNLGDPDAAEALFSEALLKAPGHAGAHANLTATVGRDSERRRAVREQAVRDADTGRMIFQSQVRARLEQIDPRSAPPIHVGDVYPGDLVMVRAEGLGHISGVAEQIATGRIFRGELSSGVAHVVTVVGRDPRSYPLFLDNQPGEGPRVIGQAEFERRYGKRPHYVARPQLPVDGAQLLEYARDQARAQRARAGNDTLYGFFGEDMVCSETAGVAIARATGIATPRGRVIDITPGDFLDQRTLGKYFVVLPMER